MIRPIEARDIPALRAMGFAWEFGSDYFCGMVRVDAEDQPLQCMAAWVKPEVHMGMREYSTPAVRWQDMQQLHVAFEQELARRGVKEVVTFFEKAERFCRRLKALQWVQSTNISFHREVRRNG